MTPQRSQVHPSLREDFDATVARGHDRALSLAEERARRHSVHRARKIDQTGVAITDGNLGGVPVRTYVPTDGDFPGTTVLWIHGGGWVLGDALGDDPLCTRFARDAGARVVAVDYRLAPEHPFPAALDDVNAVLDASLETFGGTHVLAGASAGGSIATGLALQRRDRKRAQVDGLLLICPALDDRSRNDEEGPLRRVQLDGFWSSYIGEGECSEYAAPARAASLDGLPETFIFVTSTDPLRAEGIEFAAKAIGAGVPCTLRFVPGGYHGFEYEVPDAAFTLAMTSEWVEFLRRRSQWR